MAAIFTQEDLTNVKNALLTAAIRGYASVTVNGERVENISLADLEKLVDYIRSDLANDVTASGSQGGMRIRQLKPAGTG